VTGRVADKICNRAFRERVLGLFTLNLRLNTRPENAHLFTTYLNVALKAWKAAPFVGTYPPATMFLSLSPPP